MRTLAITIIVLLALPALSAFTPSGGASGSLAFSTPVQVTSQGFTEPVIRVDSTGVIIVGATVGLPEHSPLYKSANGGATWSQLSLVPAVGLTGTIPVGAEPDITIAPDDTIFMSDLTLASTWVYSYAPHGGAMKTEVPLGETSVGVDRQWIATGARAASGGWELFSTTNDVGRGLNLYWSPDGAVLPAVKLLSNIGSAGNPGEPPVYDPASKLVYVPFQNGGDLWMSVSRSPSEGTVASLTAQSFRVATVGDGQNQFAVPALDAAGNVYVAWSQSTGGGNVDVFVAVSKDRAHSWSAPVKMSSGGDNVYPWMVAGQAGHVDVVWYGTPTAGDPETNVGPWRVEFAQSLDMLSATPTKTVVTLPDIVQSGFGICLSGTGCSLSASGSRALGDFFEVALDPQGWAHIAYAKASGGNPAGVYHAAQVGGSPA